MCETELIMVPFGKITLTLKKEVALEIPLSTIHSVEVVEDGFNYRITIKTDEDTVTLSAQQKELSELRSSGVLSSNSTSLLSTKNWHEENLDDTLEALKAINV